jgi:cell pole-organizing protein PopZ
MGLLDKAKAAAEQAAAKAKEGVEDVQTKRDLGQAYSELGKVTYRLVESGELSNPELTEIVDRIRALESRTEAEPVLAGATTTTDTPPSDQPPAMPT